MARDRELRHISEQRIGWRMAYHVKGVEFWYPWCRICERSAAKQVDWLIANGYVEAPISLTSAPVNVQPTNLVGPYLERYPR